MIEKVFKFGRYGNLVGVVSEPGNGVSLDAPAICLLNSGLLHRVGAYRAHVSLARRLSGMGYTVLRFDLSGIGDSGKHQDSRPYDQQVLGDIEDAMNWLSSTRGIGKFVLVGLCTGADNAHKVSVSDQRVVGAVTLDGYSYPTLMSRFLRFRKRYLGKLLSFSSWKNMMVRCFSRFFSVKKDKKGDASSQDDRTENYFWSPPDKKKVLSELGLLMERDFKLLSIYSGACNGNGYFYKNQFFDMYKPVSFKDNVQVEYFERADHTYALCDEREKMIETICAWVNRVFPLPR